VAGNDNLRSLVLVAVLALCVGAVAAIIAIINAEPFDLESFKGIATGVLVAFVSLSVAAGLRLVAQQPGIAAIGYLAVATGIAALVLTGYLIWHDWYGESSGLAHWSWYMLIATFVFGNSSVLLAGHDDLDTDVVKLVRGGTVLALWALAVTAIAEIHSHGQQVDPKQFGITAIVYALGALTLPLLTLLSDLPASPRGEWSRRR
jgi:hypothetical protein